MSPKFIARKPMARLGRNKRLTKPGERKIEKRSKSGRKKEALSIKKLVEREKELTSNLFGFDSDEEKIEEKDNIEETLASVTSKSPEKKKIKKEIKKIKEEKKEIIPSDPFDIHGLGEKKERRPAWVDGDDVEIKVKDVKSVKRVGRDLKAKQEVSEQQYSEALKKEFNQVIGGTPEWASLDREIVEDEDILSMTTGDYLSKSKEGPLPKSRLQYKKVCKLNQQSGNEGTIIKCVEFNRDLPMALVAGHSQLNGNATLFKVDGVTNHKIQSVRFPNYPVKCAKFLACGKKFLASSSKQHEFCQYNMETGQLLRFPGNLRSNKFGVKKFEISPSGKLIITMGSSGTLDLFDGNTLSHIHTFYAPQDVYSLTFNEDGSRMYTHGVGGDVCIWDMDVRQCIHRFYDDGCIDGTSIALSTSHLACGSSSGVVNIYDRSEASINPSPTPVKVLSKLLTSVCDIGFNSSSEILSTVSDQKEEAIKLVHFPSMTYFENFPQNHKLSRIQIASFSPDSGFLATGNDRGDAFLFRLHHYKSY